MKFWIKNIPGPHIQAYMFNIGKVYFYVNISADDISTITEKEIKKVLRLDSSWKRRYIKSKDIALPNYIMQQVFQYRPH